MSDFIEKDAIVVARWNEYTKTSEYKSGLVHGIRSDHHIIINQEKRGLKLIYNRFLKQLGRNTSIRGYYRDRRAADWIIEWKLMQRYLFRHILKDCGNLRRNDVRFGSPGDEDLYKVPHSHDVHQELGRLGERIQSILHQNPSHEEYYRNIAEIHYGFIRIHPFPDGNGRIGRVLIDQLALCYGLPPAMRGYPRNEPHRRNEYHKAIYSCIADPNYTLLAKWIQSYIEAQFAEIA